MGLLLQNPDSIGPGWGHELVLVKVFRMILWRPVLTPTLQRQSFVPYTDTRGTVCGQNRRRSGPISRAEPQARAPADMHPGLTKGVGAEDRSTGAGQPVTNRKFWALGSGAHEHGDGEEPRTPSAQGSLRVPRPDPLVSPGAATTPRMRTPGGTIVRQMTFLPCQRHCTPFQALPPPPPAPSLPSPPSGAQHTFSETSSGFVCSGLSPGRRPLLAPLLHVSTSDTVSSSPGGIHRSLLHAQGWCHRVHLTHMLSEPQDPLVPSASVTDTNPGLGIQQVLHKCLKPSTGFKGP